MKDVCVCLTSYNRFDLLCNTINTFRHFNTYPIKAFYMTEDSGSMTMKSKIENRFGDSITLLFHPKNLGQLACIDELYKLVPEDDYIFHLEDDYTFYKSGFIEASMTILETREDIKQVWIRGSTLRGTQPEEYLEPEILSANGVQYRMLKVPHVGDWCGFSFNAGLRRKKDYTKLFPVGFSSKHDVELPFMSEFHCNKIAMEQGYRACSLLEGYCDTESSGWENSSYDKDGKPKPPTE